MTLFDETSEDRLSEGEPRSPLGMVTRAPPVTELISALVSARDRLSAGGQHRLVFSHAHLEAVREAYAASLRAGESRLHRLCELLCATYLDSDYEVRSVVLAEVRSTRRRFTLIRPLLAETLYAETDLDLGQRVLQKVRIQGRDGWEGPELVRNVVEYQPLAPNARGVHKIVSRIKAEEEVWNKVVDELFGLDTLIERDKELRVLSRYVKDVFGVKLIVEHADALIALQRHLEAQRWSHDELVGRSVPAGLHTERLEVLEVKDYLRGEHQKHSGWRAIKTVVSWWGTTFEIQLQPLENYLREQEFLTRESHAGHRARREALRDQVAGRDPLFGFFRDLLRWLFREPGTEPPHLEGVEIVLEP